MDPLLREAHFLAVSMGFGAERTASPTVIQRPVNTHAPNKNTRRMSHMRRVFHKIKRPQSYSLANRLITTVTSGFLPISSMDT